MFLANIKWIKKKRREKKYDLTSNRVRVLKVGYAKHAQRGP